MKSRAQKLHFREKLKPHSSARRATASRKPTAQRTAAKKRASDDRAMTQLFVDLVSDKRAKWAWID
jgi:hypothetical protein